MIFAAFAAAAAAVAPVGAAPASRGVTETTQTLAPGVTLTRIKDTAGPYVIRVLTIDPTSPATLDIVTAGDVGGYTRPSVQGATHGALAAINGGYHVWPGTPVHPLAIDGTLRSTGLQVGTSFAIAADESQAFVGRAPVSISGLTRRTGRAFEVAAWNTEQPGGHRIVGFTPYARRVQRPPPDACSVRLRRAGKMTWGPDGVGVTRTFKVGRARCRAEAMRIPKGSVVLSSLLTGGGAKKLKEMVKGDRVTLTWSNGWPGVADSIGGMPRLLADRVVVAPESCSSYFCNRNPRTGIGVTADGSILLVTVDGRSSASVGMTLAGFARYMLRLGAVQAINLDGGGSSTMWVAGQGVVSHPSDGGGERHVPNAVLVLPGPDPAERLSGSARELLGLPRPPVSPVDAMRAAGRSLEDPGSVGGLLEALLAGDLGPPGAPPALTRAVRAYRSAA